MTSCCEVLANQPASGDKWQWWPARDKFRSYISVFYNHHCLILVTAYSNHPITYSILIASCWVAFSFKSRDFYDWTDSRTPKRKSFEMRPCFLQTTRVPACISEIITLLHAACTNAGKKLKERELKPIIALPISVDNQWRENCGSKSGGTEVFAPYIYRCI